VLAPEQRGDLGREATEDDVVLLGSRQMLGTTVRGGQIEWSSLSAWRAAGGSAEA